MAMQSEDQATEVSEVTQQLQEIGGKGVPAAR